MNRNLVVLAVAAAGLLSARTSAQDLLQPVTLESPVVYVQFSGGGVISSSDIAKYLPRSGHFLPRGELYCQATAIGGSTPQPPIGRSPDRPAAFYADQLFRTVVIRELVPRPRTLHVGSRGEAILHAFGSEGNSVSGSPVAYGPYSQFVPKAYDRVADGSARLVWAPRYDSSPTISVWVLDRLDRFNGSYRYYPRPAIGWELEGYEVLADGAERFLFHVPASYRSRAAIWRVDAAVRQGLAAGGSAAGIPTRTYEYYESGYRAIGLAEDADGSVRILWSHPSADRAILVSYSSAGWITRVQEYRAWLAGSVATAYEETGDGSARILWRHPSYSYVDVLRSGLFTGTRHIVRAWPGTGSVIEDYGLLATID